MSQSKAKKPDVTEKTKDRKQKGKYLIVAYYYCFSCPSKPQKEKKVISDGETENMISRAGTFNIEDSNFKPQST